ncbi:MAG: peptidoglycan DD-metalloendopeptidase family protein [Anaerolineae bacterium]|nr:peptidoglycan DD-metalloendopeptidase family protein [Anaerolineae bacterium]
MDSPIVFWRRVRLVIVLLAVTGGTFALVLLTGTRAAFRPGTSRTAVLDDSTHTPSPPLAGVDADGVPFYTYAAVDPALIPALEAAAGAFPADPLTVIVGHIPPIGIYLPATGDTQFDLPRATPTAVIQPLNSPTPIATPDDAASLGIITPGPGTEVSPPPPPEYGGDNCAPAGWPAPGTLTQYFHRYHRAIDIGLPLNTAVVATHSGTVIFAGWRTDGYGNLIIIQSGQFITYYAHLNSFNVSAGQLVGRNTVIGWSGSTGNSTGPHIHYEIRINDVEVDPLTFEKRGHPTC